VSAAGAGRSGRSAIPAPQAVRRPAALQRARSMAWRATAAEGVAGARPRPWPREPCPRLRPGSGGETGRRQDEAAAVAPPPAEATAGGPAGERGVDQPVELRGQVGEQLLLLLRAQPPRLDERVQPRLRRIRQRLLQ